VRDTIAGDHVTITNATLHDCVLGDHVYVEGVAGSINIGDHSEIRGEG
jgi:glucose-1-phosphate thymidylyltransferase